MSNLVQLGPQYFPNTDVGTPIGAGKLYIGDSDTDPTIIGNQKIVNALKEDGTLVAMSQPISLSAGGVPLYNGSPVALYVSGNYSLTILDLNDAQVYYVPYSYKIDGDPFTPGNFYYPDYTEADQGVTGDETTVKFFVDEIGTTNKATIYLRHNSGNEFTDYLFSTTEIIPDNITLERESGARILDDASNASLAINGPFVSPINHAFDWGNGTGDLTFDLESASEYHVEWFHSGSDYGVSFTTAVAAVPIAATIRLLPKTYNFTTGFSIDKKLTIAIEGERAAVFTTSESITILTITKNAASVRYQTILRGIVFVGGNTSLHLDHAFNVRCYNCVFASATVKGVILTETWDSTFIDCRISDMVTGGGVGIYFDSGPDDNCNNITWLGGSIETMVGTMIQSVRNNAGSTGINSMIRFYATHFETHYFATRTLNLEGCTNWSFDSCNFTINKQVAEGDGDLITPIILESSSRIMFNSCEFQIIGVANQANWLPIFDLNNDSIQIKISQCGITGNMAQFSGIEAILTNSDYRSINVTNLTLGNNDWHVNLSTAMRHDFLNVDDGDGNQRFGFQQRYGKLFGLDWTTDSWGATRRVVDFDATGWLIGPYSETIANGATGSYTIKGFSYANVQGRGCVLITADIPDEGWALVYSIGTSLYTMSIGDLFTNGGAADPVAAGDFNIWIDNGALKIRNDYGTDQHVTVTLLGGFLTP
jgi:hypothetical protein